MQKIRRILTIGALGLATMVVMAETTAMAGLCYTCPPRCQSNCRR